jgi:predicted dehydrogenase
MSNRREFLQRLLAASAAAGVSGSSLAGFAAESASEPQSSSPSEKLGAAIVGVHGRGNEHINAFGNRKDVEIVYIVDADETVGRKRIAQIKERTGREPKFVQDLRKALEDPAVDFVSTATPNHWHALVSIWAMQHGKDMYVEKPVSHNVSEGRRIVETARKYNRICQTGTQSRSSEAMQQAMQFLRDEKIGKVNVARALCYKRRQSIGPKSVYPIPSDVNYDLWSGPAPLADITRRQFHYDWHWQWLYGNGDLGNQGIHQMDVARWGLGVNSLSNAVFSYGGRWGYEDAGETANTQIVAHDYGDKSLIFEVRGLETDKYKGVGVGVIFEGTDGYLVMYGNAEGTAAFDKNGEQIAKFSGGGDHFANFLKAVRSRKKEDLNADIEEGHLSSALCHLGNISYRLGSTIPMAEAKDRAQEFKSQDNSLDTFQRMTTHLEANKLDLGKLSVQFGRPLTVDLGTETFVNDAAANTMLTREYRAPFVVPAAGAV